ncbi:MAG: hypothetical protein OSB45_08935 [Pseudomonadales bacterium]|mgnify:CR=1 FL=1|nr:hypothetical protein [Pseudomonadales bacterium]
MATELPTQAQTLITGGGSIGCNTAYQFGNELIYLASREVGYLQVGA